MTRQPCSHIQHEAAFLTLPNGALGSFVNFCLAFPSSISHHFNFPKEILGPCFDHHSLAHSHDESLLPPSTGHEEMIKVGNGQLCAVFHVYSQKMEFLLTFFQSHLFQLNATMSMVLPACNWFSKGIGAHQCHPRLRTLLPKAVAGILAIPLTFPPSLPISLTAYFFQF